MNEVELLFISNHQLEEILSMIDYIYGPGAGDNNFNVREALATS